MGESAEQTGRSVQRFACSVSTAAFSLLTVDVLVSDSGSGAVCHPSHSGLPVEESCVSAQHPVPPPLPADGRGAAGSDCHRGWSGGEDPPP